MRPRCDGCQRPCAACLCPEMPTDRLQTRRTSVIIMQHPLETRQKLATVPVLSKCLHSSCCEVIIGRRFRKGCSSQLDRLLSPSEHQKPPVLLLFPAPDALVLPDWIHEQDQSKLESDDRVLLLIVDATWQHAKEMVSASMPFLRDLAIIPVCFPFDKSKEGMRMGGGSELILRKEPYHGFLSTMEAVARALGFLEPDGTAIQQALIAVLHRMVALQAAHLPHKQQQATQSTVQTQVSLS